MEIYKITNTLNFKVYIGKDTTANPNYYGSGVILKYAIKKHGIANFTKEIIDTALCMERNHIRARLKSDKWKNYRYIK